MAIIVEFKIVNTFAATMKPEGKSGPPVKSFCLLWLVWMLQYAPKLDSSEEENLIKRLRNNSILFYSIRTKRQIHQIDQNELNFPVYTEFKN